MTALVKNMLRGARSVFSIYPSADELSRTHFTKMPSSVEVALRHDWENIGRDFRSAIRTVKENDKA